MQAGLSDLPRAPLQPLHLPWLQQAGVQVAILRLDLVDPLISGNKGFKLQGYLRQAQASGAAGLISLGGAHSNHLHALAAAGQRLGFATVGLVRGHPVDTPTVRDLQALGMQLHWLGYAGYRARHAPGFWAPWQVLYPRLLPVPEGGAGWCGAQGCAVLLDQVAEQLPALGWDNYDGWWLAAGTGTTLAGLVVAERGRHPVYGAMAVPAGHGVPQMIASILQEAGAQNQGYELIDASRGGFAKVDDRLLAFMADSERESGVPLEQVYTAKALMALRDYGFAPGARLVFVHTGGLQGRL